MRWGDSWSHVRKIERAEVREGVVHGVMKCWSCKDPGVELHSCIWSQPSSRESLGAG